MPRVKPLGDPALAICARIHAAADKRSDTDDEYVRSQLRVLKAVIGKPHAEIAKMLGVGVRTWKSHIDFPARIKLSEQRLIQELGKEYGLAITFDRRVTT